MKAINLKVEQIRNPIGIDILKPTLSWNCLNGKTQTAFQIIGLNEDKIIFDTGKIESNSMMYKYDGIIESKLRVSWKVKLWDENNKEEISDEDAYFEYGLLNREFEAKWINPEIFPFNPEENQGASYLYKEFELDDIDNARIYASAHGIYSLYINNVRVMENILTPGTSEYWYRLPYQTFDVTKYLIKGKNRIDVILGDGWYRGCNGNMGIRNVFGEDIALLLQLEIDKKVVVKTDETWFASQDGPIYFNDLQLGEKVDARKIINNYHEVKVMNFTYDNLISANTLPIVEKEEFDAELINTPDGNKVLNFKQNIAGYISFKIKAKEGQILKIILGEYLDVDGNFSDKNFETIGRKKPLHQIIEYICKEGINEYKSQFCISGFQYALVETDIYIKADEFKAHAVYSDIRQTCEFECDNKLINQLFNNAIWSTKSNFVDIPTDCPQRERSGWTGDAALYAYTGLRIMDTYPVFRRWLAEERVVQHKDGRVRNFAPRRSRELSIFDKLYDGSTAWGDASVIVPYEMYKLYKDKSILEENYTFMKKWLHYCEKKAKKTRLKNIFNPYRKYIIDTGMHYGEWLEAGISMRDGTKDMMLNGVPDIATAYSAYSSRLMSEIAKILNKEEDEKYYKELSKKINKAYKYLELKDGHIDSKRQCRLVRPLALGLLNESETKSIAKQLNDLVVANNYHLNTGFLTTPHLCRVLAENGYIETAYKLMLQEDSPGWLFAVKSGATTIWESWDGYFGDIGVASLNHYSKGAVVSWFIDGICGIKIIDNRIIIKPYISDLLKYAKASFNSPLGLIKSSWRIEDNKKILEIEIPANVSAEVIDTNGNSKELNVGKNIIEYI